jgi:hypothetical protein
MRIEVTGADQLRAVSKQLRTVTDGKAMRREFTTELRRSTQPAVQAVKEGARNLPSHGRKHTALRRRMAAATSAQVRTSGRSAGVKVRIARGRLGPQAPAAKLFDRAAWRHPVYGRDRWVSQRGVPGWFERANLRQAGRVRAGIKTALDRIEQRLARR